MQSACIPSRRARTPPTRLGHEDGFGIGKDRDWTSSPKIVRHQKKETQKLPAKHPKAFVAPPLRPARPIYGGVPPPKRRQARQRQLPDGQDLSLKTLKRILRGVEVNGQGVVVACNYGTEIDRTSVPYQHRPVSTFRRGVHPRSFVLPLVSSFLLSNRRRTIPYAGRVQHDERRKHPPREA